MIDEPRAIPTTYRDVEFKSRLEADVGHLLHDGLGYDFLYEPQSFLLEDVSEHYQPDFYVPQLGLWIEARGRATPKGDRQIAGFTKLICDGAIGPDMKRRRPPDWVWEDRDSEPRLEPPDAEFVDYLVIRPERCSFHEWENTGFDALLVQCGLCDRYYFMGHDGNSYFCRQCRGSKDKREHIRNTHFVGVKEGRLAIGFEFGFDSEASVFAIDWVRGLRASGSTATRSMP